MPDPGPSLPLRFRQRRKAIEERMELTPSLVILKAIIKLLQKIVLTVKRRQQ